MVTNDFVEYLNTLHNEQAGNENALGEAQQTNPHFSKIKVERRAADYLETRIEGGDNACVIILTGHAGDGKTTLLFQILEKLLKNKNQVIDPSAPCGEINTNCGRIVRYYKDFSELTREERIEKFSSALETVNKGDYTIIVANTGPLIEAFKEVFREHEDAESCIIDCMDAIGNHEKEIYGNRILTLNIARLDNTSFIIPYGQKIVAEENWKKCATCASKENCPIFFNACIVRENEQALQFVKDFYTWEQEYERRATIRQISAHIAYSITGGLSCERVRKAAKKNWRFKYLFSTLFFGDMSRSVKASQIKGIKLIQESRIEYMNTSHDYDVFVRKAYKDVLPGALVSLCNDIDAAGLNIISPENKRRIIKRVLLMFPLGEELSRELYQDVFSEYYPDYLQYISTGATPKQSMKKIVCGALRMLFTGEQGESDDTIYITLRRSGEQMQNVQLLVGKISTSEIMIENRLEENSDASDARRHALYLKYSNEDSGKTVYCKLSMPLLDYFSKTCNGLIIADVDPLLTHGIESMKAKLIAACRPMSKEENTVDLLVQEGNSWKKKSIYFSDADISQA